MRRAAVLLVSLAGACGKLTEAEVADLRGEARAKTARSLAQAKVRALETYGLTELTTLPGIGDEIEGGVHAMGEGGGPPIVYVHPSCANGQTCSCDETPVLVGTTKDGGAVVVRFVAKLHTRSVRQEGVCGFGCGVPQPRQPPSVFTLPVASPAQVRVVDMPYDTYDVAARCDSLIYAP